MDDNQLENNRSTCDDRGTSKLSIGANFTNDLAAAVVIVNSAVRIIIAFFIRLSFFGYEIFSINHAQY